MVYRCNKCGKELVIVGDENGHKIIDNCIINSLRSEDYDMRIYILQCERHGRVFITDKYYIDGLALDINLPKNGQIKYDRNSVNLFMDCDGGEIYKSDEKDNFIQNVVLLVGFLFLILVVYGFLSFISDVYNSIF